MILIPSCVRVRSHSRAMTIFSHLLEIAFSQTVFMHKLSHHLLHKNILQTLPKNQVYKIVTIFVKTFYPISFFPKRRTDRAKNRPNTIIAHGRKGNIEKAAPEVSAVKSWSEQETR